MHEATVEEVLVGLNYALWAALERRPDSRLLTSLREILSPVSQQRIALDAWAPSVESERSTAIGTLEVDARGIRGVASPDDEGENSYRLEFCPALEPHNQDRLRLHPLDLDGDTRRLGLCVSVFAGRRYVLTTAMASSS